MKYSMRATVAVLLAAAASGMVLAQDGPKPEDQIRYRQSVMNVMGHSFGVLAAMAKGEVPFNQEVAEDNTDIVILMSTLPWTSFRPGTEKGARTKADMKVWSESDKFKQSADKMQHAVRQLITATEDPDKLKAQVGEVGKTCKGCHDDFRLKEFRD
jgi:cytochrome c556